MSVLYLFNPENDLALANGGKNYTPPPLARTIARDLSTLPLWYATEGENIICLPSLGYGDSLYLSWNRWEKNVVFVPLPRCPMMFRLTGRGGGVPKLSTAFSDTELMPNYFHVQNYWIYNVCGRIAYAPEKSFPF